MSDVHSAAFARFTAPVYDRLERAVESPSPQKVVAMEDDAIVGKIK